MNRIEYTIVAGLLAAAIGFASLGPAAAAEQKNKLGRVPAKSSAAKAPFLGRVVVRPSPEQMAQIRLEKRMTELQNRARAGQHTGRGHAATIGAL